MLCCSYCCEGQECTVVCRCHGLLDSDDDGPKEWWPIGQAWRRPSSTKEIAKLFESTQRPGDIDDDDRDRDDGRAGPRRRAQRREPNFGRNGGEPSRSTFRGAPEKLLTFFNNNKIIFPEHYLPTSSDSRYTQRYALHLQQQGSEGGGGGCIDSGGEGSGSGRRSVDGNRGGGWSMDGGDSPPARRRRSPSTGRQSPSSECSDHGGKSACFWPFRFYKKLFG